MVGDPIAAVAALDEETAEAALEDIRVEYEPLPTVMSVQEGLAETDAQIHEYADQGNIHKFVSLEFGDMKKGFPRPIISVRTSFIMKATPTCRWSSMRPSLNAVPMVG